MRIHSIAQVFGAHVLAALAACVVTTGCGGKNVTAPEPAAAPQWSQSSGPRVGDIYCLEACPQGIYVGTHNGLYRSTDNGTSWTSLSVGGIGSGALSIGSVLSVGGDLFAGSSGDFRHNFSGVYTSSNAGDSWHVILADQPVSTLASSDTALFAGCVGVGVFRASANVGGWTLVNDGLSHLDIKEMARRQSVLLASVYGGGLFRSDDAGSHWREVGAGLPDSSISSLCPAGSLWFLGTYGNGVFRSDDDGNTWTAVNQGLTSTDIRDVVHAGTAIFAATAGGGVFRSSDGGATWSEINKGLPILEVEALAVRGNTLLAAINDLGVVSYPLQ